MEYRSNHSLVDQLASSIHAIHRPLARSRKRDLPGKSPLAETVAEETENYLSDEEVEHDFEEPKTFEERPALIQSQSLPLPGNHGMNASMSLFTNTRRETMSTIRSHRRTRLAEKLRDVFELEGIQEVLAGEYPLFLISPLSDILQRCLVASCDLSVSAPIGHVAQS